MTNQSASKSIGQLLLLFFISFTSITAQQHSTLEVDSVDIYPARSSLKSITAIGEAIFSTSVQSPNNLINLTVEVNDNAITYAVSKNGTTIISASELNLNLSTGYVVNMPSVLGHKEKAYSETVSLPYGERSFVENNCNELLINLENESNLKFDLIFRVYNEGVGFRFSFPNDNNTSSITVNTETTKFNLVGSYTAYSERNNENGYTKQSIYSVQSLIPLTLIGSDYHLCINEAGNDDFARIALQGNNNTLQAYFIGSRSSHALPYNLPWRYVVIADTKNDLIENKEIIYALNSDDEFIQEDWEWVKPGKVFRCLDLSTQGAYDAIDFCAELNLQYMMFDAGWYGYGYGIPNESNPNSSPLEVIDAIDMQKVCDYGRSKNIGIILYINKIAWNNYNNETMFNLYESWGLAGIKLGFMDAYSSLGNKQIYRIIKEAGRRQMVINVHDNFRPTGMTRRYPNLMTTEGVRGNEYETNTGNHTTLLPYTRNLTGTTDYTICFKPVNSDYESKLMRNVNSQAHQLAQSVISYSALQHVMWYGRPYIYADELEQIDFFSALPVVWDDFVLLESKMGDHVSMARKTGDKWYLAVINNTIAKDISISLDFLDADKKYQVTSYTDASSDFIRIDTLCPDLLKSQNTITGNQFNTSLKSNGGTVAIFEECTGECTPSKITNNKEYIKYYPVPASDHLTLEFSQINYSSVSVNIYSIQGQKVLSKVFDKKTSAFKLDTSSLSEGMYIVSCEMNNTYLTTTIVIKR